MARKIKNLTLLAFVFSFPFEDWDPFGLASVISITKFLGLLYFAFSLWDITSNFNLEKVKKPLLILFTLWFLLFCQAVINNWPRASQSVFYFTFFQNIVFFWLLANDLISNKRLLKGVLLSYIFGVFLMASLVSVGIGLNSDIDMELGEYRLTFFGTNSNLIGNFASLACLVIFSMAVESHNFFGRKTFFLLFFIPQLLNLISLTGSRGALVMLYLGILILLLFLNVSFQRRIFIFLLGSILLGVSISIMLESEVMNERIISTTSEGSLGGRENIWGDVLNIYYNYPFFGVGSTGYELEIIQIHSKYKDTHNLFLYFMVTGGTAALSLYLLFLLQLFRKSVNYYRHKRSAFLFVLLMIYVVGVFKSGSAISNKLFWMVAAIIYGTEFGPKIGDSKAKFGWKK